MSRGLNLSRGSNSLNSASGPLLNQEDKPVDVQSKDAGYKDDKASEDSDSVNIWASSFKLFSFLKKLRIAVVTKKLWFYCCLQSSVYFLNPIFTDVWFTQFSYFDTNQYSLKRFGKRALLLVSAKKNRKFAKLQLMCEN